MVRLLILPLLSLATLGQCFPSNAIPLESIQHLIQTAVKIELHNADPSNTYKMKFSQISALTPSEYQKLLGYRPYSAGNSAARPVAMFNKSGVVAPDSWDWREKGAVSQVKHQHFCGSCWAFSAVGALEGQHAIKKGKMVEFSEQNLVDCDIEPGQYGCDGGNVELAFNYIQTNKGIDTEDAYPYQSSVGACRFRKDSVGETDSGYKRIPSGDEEALKAAVSSIGPISVAITARDATFMHYKDGIFYDKDCDTEELNHAVLVVGYGTDDQKRDYWIVKNSWGTSFGENGYIRMARNKGNNCGIATDASYPIVD